MIRAPGGVQGDGVGGGGCGSLWVRATVRKIDKIILNYHVMARTEGNLEFKNICSDRYMISVTDVGCQMKLHRLDIFAIF